jgi:hypothetical protein
MKRSQSLYRHLPLALPFVALATPTTFAGPMFVDSVGQPGDLLARTTSDVLEAQFRADTSDWDLRLENSLISGPNQNTINMSNSLRSFSGNSFDFGLTYSAALDRFEWVVGETRGGSARLFFSASEFDSFNTIRFATSGTYAEVALTDLLFSGSDGTIGAWPSLSASPSGISATQTNLFLGDSVNLLTSGDWKLTGLVGFGDFTHDDPGEGAAISVRLYQTAAIPSPSGMAGLVLAAGFCLARRRRA